MISFQSVTLQLGLKPLFKEASFCFYPGQKIGIIGKNGAGKTTLFAMVMKMIEPDEGSVEVASALKIAYVMQEITALDATVIDYVQSGDEALFDLDRRIQKLSTSSDEKELNELAHLHEEFESLGGYQLRPRAFQLLHGLGFSDAQIENKVRDLSGGWQIRLNLAKALIKQSDILLLDEPTNHLDVEAVMWLEKWLSQYPGMMLLISHDRVFLDNTVTNVAHIDDQAIKMYGGNYSQFEKQRAESLILQQKSYVKQQKNIAHLQSFVDRFKAKASKAKQAQSRMKMLDKIQQVEAVREASDFSFNFSDVEALGGPLLTLANADLGYSAGNPILNNVNSSILSGMRVGLLGVNGAGKSTFIKSMVGKLALLDGEYIPHPKLKIGYFEQHSIQQLHLQETPLEHLQSIDKNQTEGQLRSFLGKFAFSNEMALTKVHHFSGGEKARLALAMITYQKPNLLLLDEPTNHLDIHMRQALTVAMQTYEGAVIIVSHDRFLLEATVDEYWLVNKAAVTPFKGDLADYQKFITTQKSEDASNKSMDNKSDDLSQDKNTKKVNRKENAKKRRQLLPLKRRADKLEKELAHAQSTLSDLETQMQSSEVFEASNKDILKGLVSQHATLKSDIERIESEWLDASEAYEAKLGE
jgi:ATP-binding cassette, subfamily F, member 3